MFQRYGNYIHAANEVDYENFSVKTTFSRRGYPQVTHVAMAYKGVLQSTDGTQATLNAQMNVMQAAYAIQGQDAGLYDNNSNLTNHYMPSAIAFGGVRVTHFSWGPSRGAEYVSYRSYEVHLEADYPAGPDLTEWKEKLSIRGTGGPKTIWLPTAQDQPIQQTTQQQTTMHVTQSGSAKGLLSYPEFNQPYWGPEFEHEEQRLQEYVSQDQVGDQQWNFGCEWSYTFEGPDLSGQIPQLP